MTKKLEELKAVGRKEIERNDLIWHLLLQSFSTMGNSSGWYGLIKNENNYRQVAWANIVKLETAVRYPTLERVLRLAKVRMPERKAKWLEKNFIKIQNMGGIAAVNKKAMNQKGKTNKISFLQQFHGIGDKYSRNIWMDMYHPDFYDSIAIDERIKKISDLLQLNFSTYEEHEQFYLEIARSAGLEGWELDRLMYNFNNEILAEI
jgi:hypothetical protein